MYTTDCRAVSDDCAIDKYADDTVSSKIVLVMIAVTAHEEVSRQRSSSSQSF